MGGWASQVRSECQSSPATYFECRVGVDGDDLGMVGQAGDAACGRRVRRTRRPKAFRLLVVERLVAEEHHLMLCQCAADFGNLLIGRRAEVDAVDFGADTGGERGDPQAHAGHLR